MKTALAIAALLALHAHAQAQVLQDPTRPPGGHAEAAAGAGGGLVLQSVMIAPGQRSAIINGETVRLGGRFGNAVLVKLTENEAVLKDGEELLVLRMYPGVEKREIAPQPPPKAAAKGAARGERATRAERTGTKP
jgi:MSHA biogenesis protein MshK